MHAVRMTTPQLENGYLRIANELFDAILSADLTGNQQSVLLAVIRKTYGYNKKEDDVSASQIGRLCRIARPRVTSALNELAERGFIHKRPGRHGSIVGINKDFSLWLSKDEVERAEKKPGVNTRWAADGKAHHYVYMSTHKVTGEFYVGSRSCQCKPEQDRYIGSGNWLAMVDKVDIEKTILSKHNCRAEADAAEIEHIKRLSGSDLIRNTMLYTRTESDPCTESVQVYGNVGLPCTESVHTKDNTTKDNKYMSGKPDNSLLKKQAVEAIEYLNATAGKRFPIADANIRLVTPRIKETNLETVKRVIDAKVAQWGGSQKMAQYLRPKTLFAASNFASYAGDLSDGDSEWWNR